MDNSELRGLLAKATPGPWEVLGDNQGHPYGLEWTIEAPHLANEDDTGWIAGVHGGDGIATTGNPGSRADAELIAAAVNELPRLLADSEAYAKLRAEIAGAPVGELVASCVRGSNDFALSDAGGYSIDLRQLKGQRVALLRLPAGEA